MLLTCIPDVAQFTAGLKKKHFRVIAAVELNSVACATYRRNHPSTHLIEGDIRSVSPSAISTLLPEKRQIDLLVVCAPCQPFSNQNRHKKKEDERQNLILESIRFARDLLPRIIMFENVLGLTSENFKVLLDDLKQELNSIGYRCGEAEARKCRRLLCSPA